MWAHQCVFSFLLIYFLLLLFSFRQSDWIQRDELKDLSDTLQKIKFDAGRAGGRRPGAASAGGLDAGGFNQFSAAGLDGRMSGDATQQAWSGGGRGGMMTPTGFSTGAWPPAPPGGFTPDTRGGYGAGPYSARQTPGAPFPGGRGPPGPYGQGQQFGGNQGYGPGYQQQYGQGQQYGPGYQQQYVQGQQYGQTQGYQQYGQAQYNAQGQNQWNQQWGQGQQYGQFQGYGQAGYDQWGGTPGVGQRSGFGAGAGFGYGQGGGALDAMDSLFANLANMPINGQQTFGGAEPGSNQMPTDGGQGQSRDYRSDEKRAREGRADEGGGFSGSSDNWESDQYRDDPGGKGPRHREERYAPDGERRQRPRKKKSHRGVKFEQMQEIFKVLVSDHQHLCHEYAHILQQALGAPHYHCRFTSGSAAHTAS